MPFQNATRRKTIKLSTQAKGSINPITWDIPKTGLLAGIFLHITATVAGTLSAPNALGAASIVRRVRLLTNAGIDLINLSGAGYHYLLRNHVESYGDPVPFSTARNAVTATTFDLSMWIPISINTRDPIGLIMLQNEQTLVRLEVEFEADANVATGATVTASVTPLVEVFTVPVEEKEYPDLSLVQQIVEDSRALAATGDYEYSWPRGNHYMQVLHGYGIGATPADNWTAAKVRVNKADYLEDLTPTLLNIVYGRSHGYARILGLIPIDLMGTSGMGMFGSSRDIINSAMVTELETVLTASATGTLYTVRRMLVPLRE